MFKDKNELLKKINHYLTNEREREKIAKATRKKILKIGNIDLELKKIFKEINKTNPSLSHRNWPRISKKVIQIGKKEVNLPKEKLKEKLKDYGYIYFKKGKAENLEFREYLQAYSLEKTKKPVSCCTYNLYSNALGDYMYFLMHLSHRTLSKEEFKSFLNINQFMVTKDFLFKNLEKFRGIFNKNKLIDFVNDESTALVSFPLVRIREFKVKNYKLINKAFKFYFLYELYSLKLRKKLIFSRYPYAVLWQIFIGKGFMGKAILENINDRDKAKRLGSIKKN